MILSLPDVLIHSVFSFCDYTYEDTLKIATLNHRCLELVEAFSRDELNKIRESHRVDSPWDNRIGMRVNRATERHQPPAPSNRRMLKRARHTHLYSLGEREFAGGTTCHLVCLPDENTLISYGSDRLIRVWDLNSQQCVQSFSLPPDGRDLHTLRFGAGRIIYSNFCELFILTIEGRLLHKVFLGPIRFRTLLVSGNQMLCARNVAQEEDVAAHQCLSIVDVASGELLQYEQQDWNNPLIKIVECAVVADWLLVLRQVQESVKRYRWPWTRDENTQDEMQAGIFVLNSSDMSRESLSHYQGHFKLIKASESGGSVVAIDWSDTIHILNVSSGKLVLARSLAQHQQVCHEDLYSSRILFYGSFLYCVPNDPSHRNDNLIIVIDVTNGKRVRLIGSAQNYPWALASNGRELICGFSIERGSRSASIKAYSM